MDKKRSAFLTIFLNLLASFLFVVAFFVQDPSPLRWVSFFCAIVFGVLGFSYLRRALLNKDQ